MSSGYTETDAYNAGNSGSITGNANLTAGGAPDQISLSGSGVNALAGGININLTLPQGIGLSSNVRFGQITLGDADSISIHGVAVTTQIKFNSTSETAIQGAMFSATAEKGADYYGTRARGSVAVPAVVQSGDLIRRDLAAGYDGASYELAGFTAWHVDGVPGADDMPGRYSIWITPNGGYTPAVMFEIEADGSTHIYEHLQLGNIDSTRWLALYSGITSTFAQIHTSNTGVNANDGFLFGINSSSEVEFVNFENTKMVFKTYDITGFELSAGQQLKVYGNTTDGGVYDDTQITTGKTGASTFDVFLFRDQNGAVFNGPVSGNVYITMQNSSGAPKGAKTLMYRLLTTGEGVTNMVANLADQAQTGAAVPWASTGVVADGAGGAVKIQITTAAAATGCKITVRFVGAFTRQ